MSFRIRAYTESNAMDRVPSVNITVVAPEEGVTGRTPDQSTTSTAGRRGALHFDLTPSDVNMSTLVTQSTGSVAVVTSAQVPTMFLAGHYDEVGELQSDFQASGNVNPIPMHGGMAVVVARKFNVGANTPFQPGVIKIQGTSLREPTNTALVGDSEQIAVNAPDLRGYKGQKRWLEITHITFSTAMISTVKLVSLQPFQFMEDVKILGYNFQAVAQNANPPIQDFRLRITKYDGGRLSFRSPIEDLHVDNKTRQLKDHVRSGIDDRGHVTDGELYQASHGFRYRQED